MKTNLILLAEDSDDDASMLKREFKVAKLNNPVCTVADGESTIAYLQGKGIYEDRDLYPYPALLLLDLRMPGKDGFEVLRWIRDQPEHKNLPVIVSTGSREVHQMSYSYQLGARYFLVKPIRIKEFRHAIARIPELKIVPENEELHLDSTGQANPWQPSLPLENARLLEK